MSVTVLTPNGRRQNVKITPNTTLLQVLEEVCSKHGFKPEEYDIRYHNKILDVSSTFRYSGLPNNALLEMAEAKKQRSETSVVVGLQLEGGERLTGEFIPSDNLWYVIMSLNPQAKSFDSPVAVYMRKEVCGRENLEKTTLRSLGLTGGRAIIRFLNRTPEELSTQANVSAVLSRSVFPEVEKNVTARPKEISSPDVERKKIESNKRDSTSERHNTVKRIEEKKEQPKPSISNESEKTVEKKSRESPKEGVIKSGRESPLHKDKKKSEPQNIKESKVVNVEKKMQNNQNSPPKSITRSAAEEEEKSKVILLGERNAVAYNLNNVKPSVFEEVTDDFYDLTVADAKLLLRDAKQLCADLENAPLMTAAQRELEKNKKMLSLLNQYKKTVLRIRFPDRTVLQGTFSSVEKVSTVEKFVAEYLQNPKISFYLYTTPPKEILKSDNNLLECNCVPCALLYFGVSKNVELNQFLRSDIMDKFSSPSAAALTAYESRGLTPRKLKKEIEPDYNEDKNVTKNDSRTDSNSSAEPSTSSISTPGRVPREQESSPPFKVPKWFKMNK